MPDNTSCSGTRLFICWNQMVLFAESRKIFSLSGFYWTYDTFRLIIHASRFDPSTFKGRVPSRNLLNQRSLWFKNHKYFLKIFPLGTLPSNARKPNTRKTNPSVTLNMFLQITKHTPGRYGFSVTCLYWSLLLFLGWFTTSVIPQNRWKIERSTSSDQILKTMIVWSEIIEFLLIFVESDYIWLINHTFDWA